MSTEAHPLHWPAGWPRTSSHVMEGGRFKVTFAQARDHTIEEIFRLGGRYPIISSNIPLRRDGLPYASSREPADSGIAVYFEKGGTQMVFACDRYDRTWKNLRAIGKTIEAIRGIERWGASDMMERALSAFVALPAPSGWRGVLLFDDDEGNSLEMVKSRWRALIKDHHPDKGGDTEQFRKINDAYQQAQQELGTTL